MTIICYDGTTVAADGMEVAGGFITSLSIKKIEKRGSMLFAQAGPTALFRPLIEWVSGLALPDQMPKMEGASWSLLVVRGVNQAVAYTVGCPYPEVVHPGELFAIGADRDVALGALYSGATAEEAVHLVCERTIHAGGVIQVVDIAKELGPYMPALATLEAAE